MRNQTQRVYKWQAMWDGTVPLEGWPAHGVPADSILSLKQTRRLVRGASSLYGLPTPKVLGRQHATAPKRGSYLDGVLWMPPNARIPDYILHEFTHYAEEQSRGDTNHEGGFATMLTDVLHAFGLHEKHYLRLLGRFRGIRFAKEYQVLAPYCRDWEYGIKYLGRPNAHDSRR